MDKSKKPFQQIAASIKARGTQGALHRQLGVPEDKPIPTERLRRLRARLRKKKSRTAAEGTELKRVNLAMTFRGAN